MKIVVPGYTIEKELGEGGMCVVFLARHDTFGEKVAVKVLHEQFARKEQLRLRFINEARIMRKLDHPNIVKVRDFREADGRVFLIMDYIEGHTLDHIIGRTTGPITYEKALPMFRQILDAVSYAHDRGIVHRDLKPSNVMLTSYGEIKVTDFGIAKVLGTKGMTQTGTKLGTLHYMSPEQVAGAKEIDRRTDIYSLGMTLYEMLAGRLPFDESGDTSEFQIMNSIVNRDTQFDPREYYPHIPEWLVEIVKKATSRAKEDRYQTCREFLEAMEAGEKGMAVQPVTRPVKDIEQTVISQNSDEHNRPASDGGKQQLNGCKPPPQRKSTGWIFPMVFFTMLIVLFALLISKGEESVGETVSEPTPDVSVEVRFSQSGSVITDNETNLQWRVGPDSDTDWYEAEDWVDNLGGDWRMPTRSELQGLYDAGIKYNDWGYFENSGYRVWSGEVRDSSSAWDFLFDDGRERWDNRGNSNGSLRAFAVRSR